MYLNEIAHAQIALFYLFIMQQLASTKINYNYVLIFYTVNKVSLRS